MDTNKGTVQSLEAKLNRKKYANDPNYDYTARLQRINLNEEKVDDLSTGNGFIIDSPKAVKDDIKNDNGIYSTKYGPNLNDTNAFGNRYRCKCGYTTQRFYHGLKCPICGEPVEFKDDNFQMFGYICLKPEYHIIHPNLYMSIAFLIGEREFTNIICPIDKKDEDGHEVEIKKPKDEPYFGLGMIDFVERFDEIIAYYVNKKPAKRDYYDDIVANRSKVFIQCIPVYTLSLRPYRLDGGTFHFEGTNAIYNMMAKLASNINDDGKIMNRKKKPKNQLLYDLQMKYKELYDEITKILSGKKGEIRRLFGGRYVTMAI